MAACLTSQQSRVAAGSQPMSAQHVTEGWGSALATGGWQQQQYPSNIGLTLDRTIRELQAQLENERIRREKLEAQMDEYREEIGKLKDLQDQHQATATASTMVGIARHLSFLEEGVVTATCRMSRKSMKWPQKTQTKVFRELPSWLNFFFPFPAPDITLLKHAN